MRVNPATPEPPAPSPSATTCTFCGGDDFTTPSPLNYDLGNVYCIQCGSRHHTESVASVPPASAPAATPLMDSLRDCDEKAKDLPRWATDINAAHAAQYNRPAATPEPETRESEQNVGKSRGDSVERGEAGQKIRPAAPTGEEAETRYVAQEDAMGCGVACLAMVSGRTYAEVRATVNPAQVEVGLADQTILWWLNRERIWHRRSWMDGEWGYPVPSSGLALMLTHDAHWVVLEDGVVLDPARPTPLPRYDFRQAIEVLSPPRLTAQATELAALRARVEEYFDALAAVDAEAERAEKPGAHAWSSAPVVAMLKARDALRAALVIEGGER